jgi:uroporphyrinogen decarboxylase
MNHNSYSYILGLQKPFHNFLSNGVYNIVDKKDKKISSKQRMELAFAHSEADQIPFTLGGTAQKLRNRTTKELIDYFGIKEDPEEVLSGYSYSLYSLPLMKKLGVDIAYLFMDAPLKYRDNYKNGALAVDEWGLTRRRLGGFINLENGPLVNADLDEVKKFQGPDPYDKDRITGLRQKAEQLSRETDMTIAAFRPVPLGIFEMACLLRGTEKFYMELVSNKKLVCTLLDKLLEIMMNFYSVQIDEVGDYVQLYEYTDDLAFQNGLLMSPKMYRDLIKPRHKQLIDFVKKKAPNAKFMYHSCGSIMELIPDLVDIGIDILNPLQPLARGMDFDKMKREFGNDIVFQGGIDVQGTLRTDKESIEKEVKLRMEQLSASGGYIIGPSHNIGLDVPTENVIHLYNAIQEYGKYS